MNWRRLSSLRFLLAACHRCSKVSTSLRSSTKRACASSAAFCFSRGRSLGSCTARAAAMMVASNRQPSSLPANTMRPSLGSIGSLANARPVSVNQSRPALPASGTAGDSTACSSWRRRTPSMTARGSGGSMNGNSSGEPSRWLAIVKMTDARLVRWISGSVNSGRLSKSSSSYSRMATPGPRRPQRPLRWFADACDTGSMGSRWTLVRWLNRDMRASPTSMTYRTPGTVSDVSATLVDTTIRRRFDSPKTRCCSLDDRRA